MKIKNLKNIIGLVALFSVAVLALASNQVARAGNNRIQPPELPASCGSIEVPAGNKAFLRVYAIGVQVYTWNDSAWIFKEPMAKLYAKERFKKKVGIHYVGPTWESKDESKVVAARVPNTGCTPDSSAIPWLLLQTTSTDGEGIFSNVTYIQRVNTAGGLTPVTPGSTVGEEKGVPYTAEYYFYRAEN